MAKQVKINGKTFFVNENEYNQIHHKEYTNLKLIENLAIHERLVALLTRLLNITNNNQLFCIDTQFGGYIPLSCINNVNTLNVKFVSTSDFNKQNILKNINNTNNNNITYKFISDANTLFNIEDSIIFTDNVVEGKKYLLDELKVVLVTKNIKCYDSNYICYHLSNSEYYIYIHKIYLENFKIQFKHYINDNNNECCNVCIYDNLINLCIMVKNAGPQFEQMLLDNLHIIDKWTILDTGSTDETIDIINRVLVGKKEGNLYQEPFINFRDSRNRLLDLAITFGNNYFFNNCKYIVMLDDTYIVKGDLRNFLTEVRSDQYSNSFTTFIQSDDTKYGSNRIIKSDSGLRYIHKIHEVITDKDNINVVIPENRAWIEDRRFDYMEKRTQDRKQLDLQLLYEEVEENPQDPRAYYYLAQTYNLLEDYEKAFYYFMKRCEFINSGFLQERVDAAFEAARIANFKLNKPWVECEELYNKAFKIDESRPETQYFIGIHYYLENNMLLAYKYLKKGFEIGFPIHCQYSLKPTLSYHFLPKFLTRICYELEEYIVGEQASLFFLQNNKQDAEDYQEIVSWYNIFVKLNMYSGDKKIKNPNKYNKPLFVFVADGGFNQWTGSTILEKGVGGSETYIIEMARYIQQTNKFQTIVFCNTPNNSEEIFENTIYKPLSSYYEFINTHYVNTCIVSRFSEYLPVTYKGFSENVYLVVHDLTPSGVVIPMDIKLKNIFCLTEWHVSYLTQVFPQLANITVPFYYGIDDRFKDEITDKNVESKTAVKIKNKFIYSSFPNRGLLQLLEIWPIIIKTFPTSTLHIYSDVNNKWLNDIEPEKMTQIRSKLDSMCNSIYGIHYHGWVSKNELCEAWKTADIWFYPCTFMETFCLTALEAASSRTFIVTNHLAALQNTVGDRGCIIKGDANTNNWKKEALQKLFYYMNDNNKNKKQELIDKNFAWASTLSWKSQANKLLDTYILPNTKIEYKCMYNWTNDLPAGEKQVFLDILKYFNNTYSKKERINVLEIGTYTGVSLINIINSIPNSYGIGVDMWTSYNENNLLEIIDALEVEKSFYKNISTFGLTNRITGIKSDSTDALTYFLKRNLTFDFIYVDGSHLLLDCYSDLVLSWYILENGGILSIDDYLYKNNYILDSPFEAVNHFLKRYEGKYNILYKGYRIFLQKI